MSKKLRRYYANLDKHTSKAYAIGRDFEYRVMALLRRHGWHCMRRFGSHGVLFCNKCKRHIRRPRKGNKPYCVKCKSYKNIIKPSLDVTAYKNGLYLLITCKFSVKSTTTYLDDRYWMDMNHYARTFNAIPIFAGIDADRKVYFVDLRTRDVYSAFYRQKVKEPPKKQTVDRLMQEAWNVIDFANKIIGESKGSPKLQARWMAIKINMINHLTRLMFKAGTTGTSDDLTKLLERAKEAKASEKPDKSKTKEKEKKKEKGE